MSFHQDVAPAGGFPPIKIGRYLPKKGFSSITLLAITTGIIGYGLTKYIVKQREENVLRRARQEERTAFIPKLNEYVEARKQFQREAVQRTIQADIEAAKKKYNSGTESKH